MAIAYKSQGAGAGTETTSASLDLVCPATVDANDILIAQVMHTGTTTAPTEPSGWTLLYGPANVGTTATARQWVFGKLAAGTEDGATVGFGTDGGTNGRAGRIYSFSGYVSGTLADVVPAASFTDIPHATDPQGPTVTTTMPGALAVALTCQDDNNTEEAIASATGGTWGGFVTYVDANWGPQGVHIDIQVATPTANPGTITGGATVAVNDEAGTIGFEIREMAGMVVPAMAAYGPLHTILEDGGTGVWDRYLDAVQDVVKFGSTYFLFYTGFESIRGDGGEGYRALGVATSSDLMTWTKSPSNPIITFTPGTTEDEEGVQGCGAVVSGGKIHVYYGGLRSTGGGNVDTEIRYRESSDGHSYTNDTLILDDPGDEISPLGAYVDSGGDFHVYYAGPMLSGVGDLKRLTGSTPTNLPTSNTLTTSDFYANGNVIEYDATRLLVNLVATHGTVSQRVIYKSALGVLGAEQRSLDLGATRHNYGVSYFESSQWYLFNVLWESYAEITDESRIVLRTSPDLPAFDLSASANIAASAATATTALLTAPAGKTTGDFEAARISDDTNPLPSINLTADAYTEAEFCLEATADAKDSGVYQFRVTNSGTPLDTYTVTPEWTVGADPPAVEAGLRTLTLTGAGI